MNNTREHILEVSFNLFMRKSFKEVTIREIAEKTGMSQGAFFHYFKTKDQLFSELIDNTISSVIDTYCDKLNKNSLYEFYNSYINYFVETLYGQNYKEEYGNQGINYLSFIFDALKLFPSFQEKLMKSQKAELDAWTEVVANARNSGEIKSLMTDEQIVRMFIFSSDGAGIRNIFMRGSMEDMRDSMLELWNGFYSVLRA